MTQNKFWLVWSPQGKTNPQKRYNTQESAIADAKKLSECYPKQDVFVLPATHHFKSTVTVVETPLEATPEELSEVVPKFKIGDRIYHIALKQYGVITQYNSGNKRICLVLFDGDKAENIVSQEFLVTQTIEPTAGETPTDTPKNEFKIGDRVKHNKHGRGWIAEHRIEEREFYWISSVENSPNGGGFFGYPEDLTHA